MIMNHIIKMDLQVRATPPRLAMVQNDIGSRTVEIRMLSAGAAWIPEKMDNVFLRFRKSDGTGGSYDTLPDGTRAWEWSENVIRIQMAPQVLTVPGLVEVQAALLQGSRCLATFAFQIDVEEDPSAGAVTSENYINWTAWTQAELDNRLAQARDSGEFDGACFTPGVDAEGNLCWSNDQDRANPLPVNIVELLAQKLGEEMFLRCSGGTMTGPIVLPAPTESTHAVNREYVDGRHMTAEVILTAAGWEGSVAPYTQNIAVSGILGTDMPHWGIVYSADTETARQEKEGFASVDDLETAVGLVTFTCLEDKPDVDLTIFLEVNR